MSYRDSSEIDRNDHKEIATYEGRIKEYTSLIDRVKFAIVECPFFGRNSYYGENEFAVLIKDLTGGQTRKFLQVADNERVARNMKNITDWDFDSATRYAYLWYEPSVFVRGSDQYVIVLNKGQLPPRAVRDFKQYVTQCIEKRIGSLRGNITTIERIMIAREEEIRKAKETKEGIIKDVSGYKGLEI